MERGHGQQDLVVRQEVEPFSCVDNSHGYATSHQIRCFCCLPLTLPLTLPRAREEQTFTEIVQMVRQHQQTKTGPYKTFSPYQLALAFSTAPRP